MAPPDGTPALAAQCPPALHPAMRRPPSPPPRPRSSRPSDPPGTLLPPQPPSRGSTTPATLFQVGGGRTATGLPWGPKGGGSHDAREDRGLPLAGSSAIPWHLKRRTEFLGLMLAKGACEVRVLRSGGGGGSRMGRVFAKCFLSRVCGMPEATALMLRGPPGNRRGCP